MTLIMGIAAQWGMWQSSDYRLLELPSGRHMSNASMKHLGVKTADGAALIGYTGIGRIDGEDVSDWLRKTLRGEDRSLEAVGDEIAKRATERISPLAEPRKIMHAFVLSAFLRGEAFIVAIVNSESPFADKPVRTEFSVTPIRVVEPVPVLSGGGVPAITRADRELLERVSKERPRDVEEYLGLLAAVNNRAAESSHPAASLVSPGCLASYLSPEGQASSHFFGPFERSGRVWPPFLLHGVDTTEVYGRTPALRQGHWHVEWRRRPRSGGEAVDQS